MSHTRRNLVRVLALVVMLCCTACPDMKGPNSPPSPTLPPSYQEHCSVYCGQLRKLGCEGAQPLPDGTSCETFCIKTNEEGHRIPRDGTGQPIPTERIAPIQSCKELER
jgi:hypothetical protein